MLFLSSVGLWDRHHTHTKTHTQETSCHQKCALALATINLWRVIVTRILISNLGKWAIISLPVTWHLRAIRKKSEGEWWMLEGARSDHQYAIDWLSDSFRSWTRCHVYTWNQYAITAITINQNGNLWSLNTGALSSFKLTLQIHSFKLLWLFSMVAERCFLWKGGSLICSNIIFADVALTLDFRNELT